MMNMAALINSIKLFLLSTSGIIRGAAATNLAMGELFTVPRFFERDLFSFSTLSLLCDRDLDKQSN